MKEEYKPTNDVAATTPPDVESGIPKKTIVQQIYDLQNTGQYNKTSDTLYYEDKYDNNDKEFVNFLANNLYIKYLTFPLADITDSKISKIYNKGYVKITGLGFCYPDLHRYFTKEEFVAKLQSNREFIKLLLNL